jgi:hypothetical protein
MRDRQVDSLVRRDAEADLGAALRHVLGGIEQPVLGELLEVPVMMALLAVEAHRAGPYPADDPAAPPEVLVGRHHRRCP